MSWSKVGKRLGYSRQRIHQLIKLLELPEPILVDVRAGEVTERDTRIYHRLEDGQQQLAVYQAWRSGELTSAEAKRTVELLRSGRTGSARQAMVIVKTNQDKPPKPKQSRPISRLAKMRLQLADLDVDGLTEEQSAAALDLLQRLEYDVQTLIERLIAANR
jgi:hypothetical protein